MVVVRHKPSKPYPTFPLTAHPNGQWCKKIRGKLHFFGVWADPQAAMDRYLTEAADLHAGREPHVSSVTDVGISVKEASNAFLAWQKDKLDAGEIGPRWFEDCRTILEAFAKHVGKARAATDLTPGDFQRYRAVLAKRLGNYALRRHITVVKGVFKYAYDMDLLEQPVRFGRGFDMPSATQVRKAKQRAEQENGRRLFTREEVLRILDEPCEPCLRAAILLAINGGFGNSDCATLPLAALDLKNRVINYARQKTGLERIVPLWSESVAALQEVLTTRPHPEDTEAAKLVFLSPRGKPLVRHRVREGNEGVVKATKSETLSPVFAAHITALGMKRKGIGFYTLRHTFRTWADETHDQHAVHRIMGHAIPGMSGIYVEEISLARLRAVVEHVRKRLWPDHT